MLGIIQGALQEVINEVALQMKLPATWTLWYAPLPYTLERWLCYLP
jgi:hypothetical protein